MATRDEASMLPLASPLMVNSSARMSACTLPVLSMVRWFFRAICPSTRPSITRSPPPVRLPLMTMPLPMMPVSPVAMR